VSGRQILSQASDALRKVLFEALIADKLVPASSLIDDVVTLAPPAEKSTNAANTLLSLWLYLVTENEHLKNRPNSVDASGVIRPPPLGLILYYLLTPGRAFPDTNDLAALEAAMQISADVLGAALEAVHSAPILPVAIAATPDTTGAREELHLSLCRMRVEELAQIWQALDRPYRLSVCLKVNVVQIDSA
jgi:hypothetical protein